MTFEFSGILLRLVDNRRSISYDASTVGAALNALVSDHPQLRPVLLDETGTVRQAHRVSLNGELLSRVDPQREIGDDDQIEFLTAIAGG